MALKGTWAVAIGVLLLVWSQPGTSRPRKCVPPYVLRDHNSLPEHFQPDTPGKYKCPTPDMALYGQHCFFRRLASDEVSFNDAKEFCKIKHANTSSVNDLNNPYDRKAALYMLTQAEENGVGLLTFKKNTCLVRSGNQFCVDSCQEHRSKMYVCKCPAEET
uniref:C-type lectin domain-containing protein n=1 Tax=Branchiostoma floridae TaxID=7739 RepID=C3Y3N3_BRAFL|eukprot:XP_002608899.1 hypothetical protein BRAFLDRAFT_124245 [Branchiostoma floridae]